MTRLILLPVPILKDNYVWAIVNPTLKETVIVDPGESIPINRFLQQEGLTLKGILLTHHHWDHTGGATELKNLHHVPVFGGAKEPIDCVTHPLKEGDHVSLPGFDNLSVMDIPGHTLGHIAFYNRDMVFCGDTLFSAGCGRMFEGTPMQLYTSLQKLAALPASTQMYCGHEYTLDNLYFAHTVEPSNTDVKDRIKTVSELRKNNSPTLPSTIKIELDTNPFLRCHVPEIIANVERTASMSLKDPVSVFTHLRKWKDGYKPNPILAPL